MYSKFFSTHAIADKTTRITGVAGENAYLLEGSSYALLIDTLTGAGNLAAFCRELTDFPIHVVLTHGHRDHSGGCYDFPECSVNPDDIRILYAAGSVEHRKDFIAHFGGPAFATNDVFTPPCALRTYPVYDGDSFDLGGRLVEVIGVPGHTRGSIVLLDRSVRVLFSGDACNTNTLLYLDGSASIVEYEASLLRLRSFEGEFDELWGGHNGESLPPQIIDEALVLCDRILAGTDAGEEGGILEVPYYYAASGKRSDGTLANIGYRKEWIREAPDRHGAPLPLERVNI